MRRGHGRAKREGRSQDEGITILVSFFYSALTTITASPHLGPRHGIVVSTTLLVVCTLPRYRIVGATCNFIMFIYDSMYGIWSNKTYQYTLTTYNSHSIESGTEGNKKMSNAFQEN